MSLTVPPFSFYKVPEPHEMADELVLAITEEEREEAHELLVAHILPVKLAAIDRHPRPQRLTAVVYREIARLISARPPNMRLHALRLCAFKVFIEYMMRETQNLAVARYLLDNPTLDADSLGHYRSAQVAELQSLSAADIADIAERALESVEEWKNSITDSYPAEWNKHRDTYQLVYSGLRSAITGEFRRAGGQLYEFLVHCGQSPTQL